MADSTPVPDHVADAAAMRRRIAELESRVASQDAIIAELVLRAAPAAPVAPLDTRGAAAPAPRPDGTPARGLQVGEDLTENGQAREECERLQSEVARLTLDLRQERDVLDAIFENTTTQCAYLDAGLNFVWVNSAYAAGCGHTMEDLVGRNHFELFPDEENQAIFERVRDTGEPARFLARPHTFPDQPEPGTTYWDGKLVPVKNGTGQVRGLVFSLAEVTDAVLAHRRIEELAEQAAHRAAELDAMIAAAPSGVTLYDAQGHVLRLNAAGEALFGPVFVSDLPPAERVSGSAPFRADGSPLSAEETPLACALRGQACRDMVIGFDHPDRGRIWASVSAAPVLAPDGSVRGAVGTHSDITPLVQAQERLEQANDALEREAARAEEAAAAAAARAAELEAIFAAMAEAVTVHDTSGRIYRLNEAAERLFGFEDQVKDASMAGRTEHTKPIHADGTPFLVGQTPGARCLRGEVIRGEILGVLGATGERVWTSVSGAPIIDAGGAITGAVLSFTDITALREVEASLQAANRDLETERERLDAILEQLPSGVMVVDANSRRFILMNNQVERILRMAAGQQQIAGYPSGYQCYRADGSPYGADDYPIVRAALTGERIVDEEILLRFADGDEAWVAVSAAPVCDRDGTITAAAGVLSDITERKAVEEALRQSEEWSRHLVQYATTGIYEVDFRNRRFRSVNDAMCQILGYTREELMAMDPADLLDDHGKRCFGDRIDRGMAGESIAETLEYRVRTKDGRELWAVLNARPTYRDGKLDSAQVIAHDITERKRAEEERSRLLEDLRRAGSQLETERARLEAIFFAIADPVIVYAADGRLERLNPAAQRLLGSPSGDAIAGEPVRTRPLNLRYPDGVPVPVGDTAAWRALEGGTVRGEMAAYDDEAGRTVWVSLSAAPVRATDGANLGAVLVAADVTALRQAQEQLEQARALLAAVLEQMPSGVIVAEAPSGRIVIGNEQVARIWRQPFVAVDSSSHFAARRAFHPDGRPYRPDDWPLARAFKKGETVIGEEIDFERGDGSHGIMRASAAPIRDQSGHIIAGVVVFLDVTKERQAERALARERERLAVTLRSIGDGVIATDAHGCVTTMNRVAEALTGWHEQDAIGRPLAEVYVVTAGGDDHQPLRPAASTPEAGRAGYRPPRATLQSRDGTERLIAAVPSPIVGGDGAAAGTVLVFQDVTLQQRLEEELLKANKLESLGVLAGGIAHDFNNLLTGIIGNVALASMDAPEGSEQEEVLDEARKASDRARGLAQQLLTFARGGEPVIRVQDLREVLVDASRFALRGALSSVDFHISPDLWPVRADAGQIAQVIQNLVINADQAMPGGGRVTVRAANIMVTESDPLPLAPGAYVKVTVADTGVGIPAHLLTRIFDPYFTTKPSGSGIGLAVCYSVVAKHEGHIAVASCPGEGSEFDTYLPALAEPAGAEAREPSPGLQGVTRGKVLVMDDETTVTRVARRMLARLGYEAVTVSDGAAAATAYRQAMEHGEPFTVVILDLVVPQGLGGTETLVALKKIDPNVRAVVSSGYAGHHAAVDYAEHGFAGILTKPYTLDELEAALLPFAARG